jgi:hypothetical protein
MANPEHLKILEQGVEVWNRWRAEASISPDLRNAFLYSAHLSGVDLHRADMRRANLQGAKLTNSRLSQADLREADLRNADLNNADLSGADFHGAQLHQAKLRSANLNRTHLNGAALRWTDLREACLGNADLRGADLTNADLRGTNLRQATLGSWMIAGIYPIETILTGANLHGANNLDACVHIGPSTIDHRTIAKSGRLPLSFLRGCGLPDALIDYLPSLLNEPIQLYSVFISYSHRDEAFAKRLYDALQGKGVRCWYAPEDVQGGKKIHEQIDAAIRVYDKLLLILSEHSMNSEWVKTEIANARRREVTQNRRILFPIRLVDFEAIRTWTCFDADTGKDSAREIREYYIPDFSNWKDHDSFEKAFTRLLRDLKADETPTST